MDIGMIGLGRMGANMAARLVAHGHRVVGHDRAADARAAAEADGIEPAASLEALAAALAPTRAVWMMVPAGAAVDATIDALVPILSPGDLLIDGGNSAYGDSMRRAGALAALGLGYVDAGVSGGVWGRDGGYSLMLGGAPDVVGRLTPIAQALAPAPDRGWGHVGPSGAGHFVKMIHNGIEYGLMQAYAEGFAIMKAKEPMQLDLAQIAGIWQHGSVVRSWLLDLSARALAKDADLGDIAPWVDDSGFGRGTVKEAIDLDVAAPVITHALIARLESRDRESFGYRMLAALRAEFGGHAVRKDT
ncbi:MAG TPA: decarboxylating 6-phosphogluconate dehydrogenase [Vicinamibacterales bacterium]|nr:decarboxylating 6-phosphogluconate dehydrogenase [Vicinamibacterales bacterium]